ncbi:hypothetical protein [Kitasatospora sp. NPDC127116]|uniref:hypothetical protein n=1 Tax=Kitasatospora sp. NPDC127116 TaxID=3345367 RepID=UPI003643A222
MGAGRRRTGLGGTVMVIHRFKRHRAAATGHDEIAVRHEATVLVEAANECL